MAKFYGVISGKGSGKLGNVVLRIRQGEQIVATYNPVVANPKSKGQSDQRAKFKLMTQLAAVMAFAIAMEKTKGGTARNSFVSYNFPSTAISEVNDGRDAAVIPLEGIQLTRSTSAFVGEIAAELSTVEGISSLTMQVRNATNVYDYVKYAVFELNAGSNGTMSVSVRPARVGRLSTASKDDVNYRVIVDNFIVDAGSRLLILAYGMNAKDGTDLSYENTGVEDVDAIVPIAQSELLAAFDLSQTSGLIISQ